jgi:hypothetical protein
VRALVGHVSNAEVWEWGLSRSLAWVWFRPCTGLGGVAARQSQPVGVLRVVPGTNARTKGLTGHLANREVGWLRRCFSCRFPWLDAVAAASGISEEVSFAVAADDSSGACILHAPVFLEVDLGGTTMNWRGRTVEYSSDSAKHTLLEVPCADLGGECDCCPICSRVKFHCGKRFFSLNGWGLAVNNPIFLTHRVRACSTESIVSGCSKDLPAIDSSRLRPVRAARPVGSTVNATADVVLAASPSGSERGFSFHNPLAHN